MTRDLQIPRLRWTAFWFVASSAALLAEGIDSDPEQVAFFEEKIRPILATHCYKCHSEEEDAKIKSGLLLDRKAGWVQGGESFNKETGEEVIVPGKPDESALIKMVERDPDYDAMPPKTALKKEEMAALREWVARGAPDPRSEAIGEEILESEFDLEERKGWWSLQPVAKVVVPSVKDGSWATNEVDRFLQAEMEKKGWKPSPEARKEHLLRRLSITLTGLAPTEEELAAFLADDSPQAYEKQVDRLMASPHFGERWARHWMDVVRFAETKAFEADYTMPYVHRFRDYLIRAFNDDVPYDVFVMEAFAGDLLDEPRLNKKTGDNESVAGPGFLYLTDGQHGPPDIHGDEARVFDSMIQVAGVAFQGLTVSCARCHDHKFDAITDEDYYSFYGMLRSSRLHYANMAAPKKKEEAASRLRTAKRDMMSTVFAAAEVGARSLSKVLGAVKALQETEGHRKRIGALNAKLNKGENYGTRLEQFRKASEADVVAMAARSKVDAGQLMKWLVFASSNEAAPELRTLKGLLAGEDLGKLRSAAERVETSNQAYSFGLTDKSFGEWIVSGTGFQLAGDDGFLPAMSGERPVRGAIGSGATTGALSGRLDGVIRSPDFILDGKPVDLWVRGRNAAVHLVVRNYELVGYGPTTGRLRVEVNSDQWRKVSFATNLWKGEPAYLEILHHGAGMKCLPKNAKPAAPDDNAWIALTAGDLPRWGRVWLPSMIDAEERLEVVAKVVTGLIGLGRQGELNPAEREVLGALLASGLLDPTGEDIRKVGAARDVFRKLAAAVPRPVYLRSLADGQSQDQPVFLRGDHKKISEQENPRRFLDGLGGMELKSSGSGRLEWAAHVADPKNPLTARVRVNRIWSRVFGRGLVASVDDFGKMGELPSHPELLDYLARDFMENGWSTKTLIRKLVMSRAFRSSSKPGPDIAKKDPKNIYLTHMPVSRMDAESVRDHILACSGELKRDLYGPSVPANIDDQPHSRAKPRSGPLNGNGRRSLYVETRRNFLSSFLRVFDMPNATEPVGQRNVTNVPAQSLALMNDRFVHEQTKLWAKRIMGRKGSTDERLHILHRQAFGRDATEAELRWGRKALGELGGAANPEQAWTAFCHLMINRKEFIYVF